MTRRAARWLPAALLALSTGMAFGQIVPLPKPEEQPRDIGRIDATPLVAGRLAGAYEISGRQRIDGELRRPLVDFSVRNGSYIQRVSFFEGGLVCVHLTDANRPVHKKLLFPDEAVKAYLDPLSPAKLRQIPAEMFLFGTAEKRLGTLRVYQGDSFVERTFDPRAALPKALSDLIMPLENLLRLISEDNRLTNRIAGYQPRVGDSLIGDDQSTYEVVRILEKESVIELRRDNQPTTIYVSRKDILNYFAVSWKVQSR